jgi:hypothetical protein
MKKLYIVPNMTIVQIEATYSIVTTSTIGGGQSNKVSGITDAEAPKRHCIWDEE